ncbi:hypothetical protein B7494_g1539 [Chlorociboria aeruginascens]|nr:hypothetical protein B7494_g1539 [Chlorociboria aeruginascens]
MVRYVGANEKGDDKAVPLMAGPRTFRIQSFKDLAVPGSCLIMGFVAYSSQFLFHHIEPEPLSKSQTIWFNVIVLGVWWSYYKTCSVDPGPKGWVEKIGAKKGKEKVTLSETEEGKLQRGIKWCKKCDAVKPPRAHHCRQCGRCIPKMDHHCPWTSNCVSYTTFPHFIRYVMFSVLGLAILLYHLSQRALHLWSNRNLPAYLGPPVWTIVHLLILLLSNSFSLFALSILLTRAVYSLATNTTMIESWEIERHEALIDRARKTGGWIYGNSGLKIRVERQEFPYDVGIWRNLCLGMGSDNPLLWILPFSGEPKIVDMGDWEINGFESEDKIWPPLDPDKLSRGKAVEENVGREYRTLAEEKEAFRERQRRDYERWGGNEDLDDGEEYESEYEEGVNGEGWTNSDGDRLRDYGVDEDAEILDDDIPLGELLRRRKARELT